MNRLFASSARPWLALAMTVSAFGLILMARAHQLVPHVPYWGADFRQQMLLEFNRTFASERQVFLLAVLLFGPVWAVYVSRLLPRFGGLMLGLTVLWLATALLHFLGMWRMSSLLVGLLFSLMMIFLGMCAMLYRVWTEPEEAALPPRKE